MKSYADALAFIRSRQKFHRDPTLKRMRRFMRALGDPQRQIKAIHVTGTNGKGSTVTFLRNLLEQAGYTVGTFTSPHLIRFNERISVNGHPISDQTVLRLTRAVAPAARRLDRVLRSGGPTEFEVVTAMMFKYFAEGHADVVVVEVGIGGRYDSTNVLLPEVSAITTVGYDHMRILGNTLPQIAFQKAGIIKKNRPSVAGRISPAPLAVIKQEARKQHSSLAILGRDFTIDWHRSRGWGECFDFRSRSLTLKRARINLIGSYQVDNAAVALATFIRFCQLNRLPLRSYQILKGLAVTRWAGRFERVHSNPLVVIDGAHNVPAIQAIRPVLARRFAGHGVYVVLAIFADKQYRLMVRILAEIPNVHLFLTNFIGPGGRCAANLKPLVNEVKSRWPIKYFRNWRRAIAKAGAVMTANDVLLITGSLYFISHVRPLFTKDRPD